MMGMTMKLKHLWMGVVALAIGLNAVADEASIRKNLAERLPKLPPIEEVSPSPMPGLYEVRFNSTEIIYTDADGNFVLQGSLIDTKAQRDLTEERINRLSAIKFDTLPVKDAFTIVRGNGARKLAVFQDPNCPYCKQFERELAKVDNITVYMFLYPILGPDSADKARSIWCAKDRAKTWQDWMVRGTAIPASSACDVSALARNVDYGRKFRVTGTPTLVFSNGLRIASAMSSTQIEKNLADAGK